MNGHPLVYSLITLLLVCILVLPAIFGEEEPIIDRDSLTGSLRIYGPLLIILMVLFLQRVNHEEEGRQWILLRWADVPIFFALLAATLFIGSLMPYKAAVFMIFEWNALVYFLVFSLSFAAAAVEELLFRWWMIAVLPKHGLPLRYAVPLSILTFALGHLWAGWNAVYFAGLTALIYTIVFLIRPRIIPLILAHTLHNLLAIILASIG